MGRMLPDLYQGVPVMGSELLFAIVTLGILFYKLDNFCLLNLGVLINASNELDFDAYSFGMRLSPYKFGLLHLGFAKAFYFSDQNSKELRAFSITIDPWRSFVSLAVSAVELFFSRVENVFVIDRRESTGGANIRRVRCKFQPAQGAEYTRFLLGFILLVNKHQSKNYIAIRANKAEQ